ncbi:hypothetical protein, partial [Vibrio parahaemolyticus]|uniref:hypothetical protein n=1 Tax=Vibrio parahaemolyticus TaxID=670 RepID=UPI002361AE50
LTGKHIVCVCFNRIFRDDNKHNITCELKNGLSVRLLPSDELIINLKVFSGQHLISYFLCFF